jgi:hypothetical protein
MIEITDNKGQIILAWQHQVFNGWTSVRWSYYLANIRCASLMIWERCIMVVLWCRTMTDESPHPILP